MKYRMRKIAATCLFSLFSTYAWCVPAKPGLIVYTQPDGTELSVRLVGDEFGHYYLSEDGHLLLHDNADRLCYAYLAPDGTVQASALQAHSVNQRTDRELGLLETQNHGEVLQHYLKKSQGKAALRRTVAERNQRASNPYPTTGKQKVLVILAEYSDVKFSSENPNEVFHRLLNEEGYNENGATGSARDYYIASSNGRYEPNIDVYGPVELPNPMEYYGGNLYGEDRLPYQMIADACEALDSEIDFSQYDLDKDGSVDNVYLFYAGYGEADGGPKESVWPHAFYVRAGGGLDVRLDGVFIDRYACSNELVARTDELTGIGTFCHEFGHVLGLMDLYSSSYTANVHPASWDIMATGSYSNNGNTPPLMSAFERLSLDWIEPVELNPTDTTTVLPPLSENIAYRINTSKSSEYFLLENRQQTGWDKFIPGHGMLVWHIDYKRELWYSNKINDDPNHQCVDIEEADNIAQGSSRAGNTFPGTTGATNLTNTGRPNLKSWNGTDSKVILCNIHETADSQILFDAVNPEGSLDAVVAGEATHVSPVSFQANWKAVNGAISYSIDVYTKGADSSVPKFVEGYMARPVGNVLSFEVQGLQPETKYFYRVRARGEQYVSDYSNDVTVQTAEKDYRFDIPEIAEATQVTATSFVANWKELPETQKYNVTVFAFEKGELESEIADFETDALPENWNRNVYKLTDEEGYYGKAPHALLVDRNSGFVSSPVKENAIETVSFWYRGSEDLAPDSKLNLYGLNEDNKWVIFDSVYPLTTEPGGATYTCHPKGQFYSARIQLFRPKTGKVVIDDVEVDYRATTLVPLPEYNPAEVTGGLSLTVEGLQPNTRYAYSVRGNNGVLDSEQSPMCYVTTLDEESSLDADMLQNSIYAFVSEGAMVIRGVAAGTAVSVFDVSGRQLHHVVASAEEVRLPLTAEGIYIVRAGNASLKIVR